MPQLDTLSFFTQYIWLTLGLAFFLVSTGALLYPVLIKSILVRSHGGAPNASNGELILSEVLSSSNKLWN